MTKHPLKEILKNRIAIIDGAMGTTIRTYGMKEADIRAERFKDSKKDLLNNGDLFSLTQPKMICDIHRRFLEAGADIIETNTFGATSITQSEFFVDDPREHGGRKDPAFYQRIIDDKFLNDLAWEINEQSARQCREWADRVGNTTGRQRFVAGAIGPLTVSLSNSPDADDSGFRVVTFDQVKAAYIQQIRALMAGGSDLLLVETIFDSLNAKAALVAIREVFDQDGKELPVMISAAVGRGGETMISAQTIEAFWNAVQHVNPLSVGTQLLAWPRPDVSISGGSFGEIQRGHLLLPKCRSAQPSFAHGLRSRTARYGAVPGRFCKSRADQHRRRLLREYAGTHRGDRESARRETPSRARREISYDFGQHELAFAAIGLSALYATARRFHDDWRTH
jgi:5-methyltetrahydrofolate--homocysteine methyltransferase